MGLRDCRDCDEAVSEMAQACPDCGAPYPVESQSTADRLKKQRRAESGWIEIAVGVMAGLFGWSLIGGFVMIFLMGFGAT